MIKLLTSPFSKKTPITVIGNAESGPQIQTLSGAVVYLNGEEIVRSNMPDGEITYNTLAVSAIDGSDENDFFEFKVRSNLQAGENILAVEVHQGTLNSSDLGFDLFVTPEIMLPPAIQLIHNAPDPSLAEVDLYLNGELAIEGLGFRESTGRFAVPAGMNRVAISLTGTVDTAWSATDILIDFDLNATTLLLEGFDYSVAAFGVRDTASFTNETNNLFFRDSGNLFDQGQKHLLIRIVLQDRHRNHNIKGVIFERQYGSVRFDQFYRFTGYSTPIWFWVVIFFIGLTVVVRSYLNLGLKLVNKVRIKQENSIFGPETSIEIITAQYAGK